MTSLTNHLRLGSVTFRGTTYGPSAVERQIDDVATELERRCRSRSRVVFLVATNHLKSLAAYFGIIRSGRVCLLVDPECGVLEWTEMVRETAPCAVIRIQDATTDFAFDREILMRDSPSDFEEQTELEGVCTMLYTAADDGFAKAAMLTHENMMAVARSIIDFNAVDKTSCCSSLIPFHHLFGLQTGLLAPTLCEAHTCIQSLFDLANPAKVAADLRTSQVTHLYSVPVVYNRLAEVWSAAGTVELPRRLVSGGCKLPTRLFEQYRDRFNRQIHEGYGLTEAAPICTWHRPDDEIRPESVGRALDCCEIGIDDGSGVVPGGTHVGEVCIRGSNVMKGYFRHRDLTTATLREGWLRTGDLGRLDGDGYLHLTGLKKRMINVSGRKIYPAEVERVMRTCDNVVDAHIYSKPHEIQGQSLQGRVTLKTKGPEAEEAFRTWCEKRISGYKIPRRIEFA